MSAAECEEIITIVASRPDAGDLIQGTGGLPKIRVPLQGRGKRGGARLVTFFHDREMPVFLITVYGKNEQDDLTPDQRREAGRLTEMIRNAYGR